MVIPFDESADHVRGFPCMIKDIVQLCSWGPKFLTSTKLSGVQIIQLSFSFLPKDDTFCRNHCFNSNFLPKYISVEMFQGPLVHNEQDHSPFLPKFKQYWPDAAKGTKMSTWPPSSGEVTQPPSFSQNSLISELKMFSILILQPETD